MQNTNITSIKTNSLVDIAPGILGLTPLLVRHFETKSGVFVSSSKLEDDGFSLDNLD